MRCTKLAPGPPWRLALAVVALLLGACSVPTPAPRPAPAPTPAPPVEPAPGPGTAAPPGGPLPAPPPQPAKPAGAHPPPLPPPRAAVDWEDFKRQAAERLVQAHPGASYLGTPPEPLLAIPVLEVELNADGSVRRIEVLRYPRQARDTVQLAIAAIQRAAPYGSMRRLPRPWKWTEVFLFDDERRFKPRTLDGD